VFASSWKESDVKETDSDRPKKSYVVVLCHGITRRDSHHTNFFLIVQYHKILEAGNRLVDCRKGTE
jgi:hypothetical protein